MLVTGITISKQMAVDKLVRIGKRCLRVIPGNLNGICAHQTDELWKAFVCRLREWGTEEGAEKNSCAETRGQTAARVVTIRRFSNAYCVGSTLRSLCGVEPQSSRTQAVYQ